MDNSNFKLPDVTRPPPSTAVPFVMMQQQHNSVNERIVMYPGGNNIVLNARQPSFVGTNLPFNSPFFGQNAPFNIGQPQSTFLSQQNLPFNMRRVPFTGQQNYLYNQGQQQPLPPHYMEQRLPLPHYMEQPQPLPHYMEQPQPLPHYMEQPQPLPHYMDQAQPLQNLPMALGWHEPNLETVLPQQAAVAAPGRLLRSRVRVTEIQEEPQPGPSTSSAASSSKTATSAASSSKTATSAASSSKTATSAASSSKTATSAASSIKMATSAASSSKTATSAASSSKTATSALSSSKTVTSAASSSKMATSGASSSKTCTSAARRSTTRGKGGKSAPGTIGVGTKCLTQKKTLSLARTRKRVQPKSDSDAIQALDKIFGTNTALPTAKRQCTKKTSKKAIIIESSDEEVADDPVQESDEESEAEPANQTDETNGSDDEVVEDEDEPLHAVSKAKFSTEEVIISDSDQEEIPAPAAEMSQTDQPDDNWFDDYYPYPRMLSPEQEPPSTELQPAEGREFDCCVCHEFLYLGDYRGILSCGHNNFCYICAFNLYLNLHLCPLCRTPIKSVMSELVG